MDEGYWKEEVVDGAVVGWHIGLGRDGAAPNEFSGCSVPVISVGFTSHFFILF